jgi:hypothetical protein
MKPTLRFHLTLSLRIAINPKTKTKKKKAECDGIYLKSQFLGKQRQEQNKS